CNLARLERPIDHELQVGRFPGYGLKRSGELLIVVLANPIESEDARHFHDELPVLPCGRPERGDPGVEVLRDQATAKLPSHLLPGGVEHPPALVVPIATRIPRDVVTTSYPQMGRSRGIPPRISRSRLRSPPIPSPHRIALPPFGRDRVQAQTSFMCKKVICCGRRVCTPIPRLFQGGISSRTLRTAVTWRASSGTKFSRASRSACRSARDRESRVGRVR